MLLTMQADRNKKASACGAFAEPSDGLEPSTPSLPSVVGFDNYPHIPMVNRFSAMGKR
jgi:hypothetical protein